jgi:hypothetical protein
MSRPLEEGCAHALDHSNFSSGPTRLGRGAPKNASRKRAHRDENARETETARVKCSTAQVRKSHKDSAFKAC